MICVGGLEVASNPVPLLQGSYVQRNPLYVLFQWVLVDHAAGTKIIKTARLIWACFIIIIWWYFCWLFHFAPIRSPVRETTAEGCWVILRVFELVFRGMWQRVRILTWPVSVQHWTRTPLFIFDWGSGLLDRRGGIQGFDDLEKSLSMPCSDCACRSQSLPSTEDQITVESEWLLFSSSCAKLPRRSISVNIWRNASIPILTFFKNH